MRLKSILSAAILSCFGMLAHAEQVMETDVVVVGAGASGSAAAYALTEQGLKVVNVEKRPQTGGTGQFSEGIFAVESKMQRENNHVFTRDQAFKLVMDYSHWRPNAKLVRNYINKSADTIDWLQNLGVHFEKLTSNYPGGYYTWHIYQGRGRAVIDVLQQRFAEQGGTLLLKTAGKQLITNDKGKIVGLMAESSTGEAIRINAKTVVIATGGFGSNKEMLTEYTRFPDVEVVGIDGKMGDGIKMAWEVGAAKDGREFINMSYRPGPSKESTTNHYAASAKQPHLWLNPKGERFTNEANIEQWPFAGNALENQGGVMFVLYDENTKNYMIDHGIDVGVGVMVPVATKLTKLEEHFARGEKAGKAFRANTIQELAQKTGMDYQTLKENIERYNELCSVRHDEDFVKDARYLRPVAKAPFYAVKSVATSLGTLGGVKVNEKLQAIDDKGTPVAGLYVIGNDAGGMYGDSYDLVMAGSTVGFAINSARIAAENIAQDLGAKKPLVVKASDKKS
ncbi:FAD-dependent oxidoreductase [Edaphovirga cremea]|uniref:FAD-dependent oxidoreductase n=1 Tax=Edaphovirga cremea TaxID=2267246 RepID=UPI001B87DB9C|nr:FAD-dependent oxidoreductase [Edaphovirga cremea]